MVKRRNVNKKANGGTTGRAKMAIPKAGITKTHRRYGEGGKIK